MAQLTKEQAKWLDDKWNDFYYYFDVSQMFEKDQKIFQDIGKKLKEDSACEEGYKLLKLIDDMGWDYDRFSSSGQETYDKICKIIGTTEEVTNAD